MKTTILFAAILSCLQVCAEESHIKPVTSVSETKPFATSFSFLRGHKQGKNTTVTWGMNNNAGVSHFIIEYTYEDPNDPYSVWQIKGVMPCTNSPIFKFIDCPVLPGTINYRITAVMNNNSTVTSPIYTTDVTGS